jgi:hypothetical protein
MCVVVVLKKLGAELAAATGVWSRRLRDVVEV